MSYMITNYYADYAYVYIYCRLKVCIYPLYLS